VASGQSSRRFAGALGISSAQRAEPLGGQLMVLHMDDGGD